MRRGKGYVVPGFSETAIAWPRRASGRGAATSAQRPETGRRHRVAVRPDLVFLVTVCLAWVALSKWLSFSAPPAVIGLAFVALNARLISFALFQVPSRHRRAADFPELTLIVATYDAEDVIEETLDRVAAQDYPGELRILVADADSTDETVERASRCAEHDLRISIRRFPHDTKPRTLNRALATVSSPLVATTDARMPVRPGALRVCAGRLLVSSVSTVTVGGTVFVSTARENLLAHAEEWDSGFGVPAQRPQDDLRGPLMAQDDFTVLPTGTARELGA